MVTKTTKASKKKPTSEPTTLIHTNTTSRCVYHVVFTPKYRRRVLVDGVADTLKKLILDKQDEYGYIVVKLRIEPDHVHIVMQCDPDKGISNMIAKIKCQSAIVMRRKFPELKTRIPCLWTRAKYVVSVGGVNMDEIKQYIKDQKNV